jgi:hydroxymethylpyrimidine pyrophosphatase-like HAD family hydrolase
MKTIKHREMVICSDVDDTLIMHDQTLPPKNQIVIKDPYMDHDIYVTPHIKHIEMLKRYHKQGYFVIIWSAGGAEWAESVAKALKLEEYCDLIIAKPLKYVDDLEVTEWLNTRVYFPYGTK